MRRQTRIALLVSWLRPRSSPSHMRPEAGCSRGTSLRPAHRHLLPASIPTVRERSSQPGAGSAAPDVDPSLGSVAGRHAVAASSAFRRPALRLRNRSSRSTGAGTPSPSGTGRSRAATVSLKQPRGRRAGWVPPSRSHLQARPPTAPPSPSKLARNHRLHGVDELPSGRPCGLARWTDLGCSCHDLGSSEQHLHPDRGDG